MPKHFSARQFCRLITKHVKKICRRPISATYHSGRASVPIFEWRTQGPCCATNSPNALDRCMFGHLFPHLRPLPTPSTTMAGRKCTSRIWSGESCRDARFYRTGTHRTSSNHTGHFCNPFHCFSVSNVLSSVARTHHFHVGQRCVCWRGQRCGRDASRSEHRRSSTRMLVGVCPFLCI